MLNHSITCTCDVARLRMPLTSRRLPDSEDTQAASSSCEKPCCAEVGLTRFQSRVNRLLNFHHELAHLLLSPSRCWPLPQLRCAAMQGRMPHTGRCDVCVRTALEHLQVIAVGSSRRAPVQFKSCEGPHTESIDRRKCAMAHHHGGGGHPQHGGDELLDTRDGTRDSFCAGHGTVLMSGFQLGFGSSQPCILFLFPGWVMNDPWKYAAGCFGASFIPVGPLVFSWWRQQLRKVG